MGNTASLETLPPQLTSQQPEPRASPTKRQPQKLSKPRVGNHGSGRMRRMSSSAVSVASSNTQLPLNPNPTLRRQSTLISPVPLSPLPPSNVSALASPISPVASPETDLPPAPVPRELKERDPSRRLSLFRSKSSHDERRSSRISLSNMPPMPGDRRSRANSMNWESEANFDYARRQIESHNSVANRQSVNYDMSSYEASRLLMQHDTLLSPGPESVLSGSNNHDMAHESWNGLEEPKETTIDRVNSEVSLYAPVRRRSIVQTPGLATRWPGDTVMNVSASASVSRHSSMRHSHPPTPIMTARSRQGSVDSNSARIMSLPLPPRLMYPEVSPRVETPSDGEYRQLGTMKFGSLRITNGAASPIPSLEGEHQLGGDDMRPLSSSQDEVDHLADAEEHVVVAVGRAEEISTPLTPRLVEVGKLSRASSFRSQGLTAPMSADPLPQLPQLNDFKISNDAQLEYSTNETLDIREDADAKPKLERPTVDPVQAERERNLARTDSGIVATPMSEASLKALSKADSGYSSNVSVRSFASKKVDGSGTESPADNCNVDISISRSPDLPESEVQAASGSKLVIDTTTFDLLTAPSPTTASASPVSPRTRPSLAAPVARTGDQQPVSPVSERRRSGLWPLQSSKSSMSIGGEVTPKPSRRHKLQRLLSGASLRSAPAAAQSEEQPVPDVPQAVEDKLQEHSGRFPTNSKRLTMNRQPSKDTLKTILSVGSVDALQSESVRNSLVAVDETPAPAPVSEPVKASRRRSIQSAASLISRTSLRRKPVGSGDRQQARLSEHEEIRNGFESHITSIDAIRNSVGRSAFDSAFAMMRVPDDEGDRQDRDRSMTMDAQTEREMELRRQASRGRNPRVATTSSRASPIPELPEMSPTALKARTPPPPISLQNRSARSVRKNPSSRPQSMPSTPKQGLSRRSSRESVYSQQSGYEDPNPPPMPVLDPRFPEFQHLRGEGATGRRDTIPGPLTSNPDPSSRRPKSAAPNTLRKQPKQLPPGDMRRQSSYEDNLGRRQSLRQQQYDPRDPPASGSYYHNQLRQLQDQQWGGQGWNEPSRYPPHGPSARHSSSRSGSRGGKYEPPYRVLHSYNSPAYRNVPIWG